MYVKCAIYIGTHTHTFIQVYYEIITLMMKIYLRRILQVPNRIFFVIKHLTLFLLYPEEKTLQIKRFIYIYIYR